MSTSVRLWWVKPGSQQPARVKEKTLPHPEGMAQSLYSFRRGQDLSHSHCPGMKFLVQDALLMVLFSSCYWIVFPPAA